jgi:Domain of unknown function (DUF4349)
MAAVSNDGMKRTQAILLAMLMSLSCRGKEGSSVATDQASPAPPPPALRAGYIVTDTAAATAPTAVPAPPNMPRVVIRNAQIAIVVGDAAAAAERLTALAGSAGGYVAEARQWRESEQLRATLTLRIPAQRLDETLAAARKLAVRVQSENVSSDDVTQEYVDLDAQVRNLEAAETEMRQLMTTVRQRMQKAQDILEVYQRLTELRGQIEQAKGRMRYLSQMAALATVKVDLIPDAIAKPVVTPGWQPAAIARDATRSLVRTLQAIVAVIIWCAIYLLPLAVVPALFILTFVRRRRRA